VDGLVDEARSLAPVVIVDFHAEATSEKVALARYLDGRVTAVLGTHTHVQTNDARVLAGGVRAR
jgi:calcineurin-like phosphoesterase